MLLKINSKIVLTIVFFLTSLLSIWFRVGAEVDSEVKTKILSLVALAFFYLIATRNINFSYVLILLISIVSDVVLIYARNAIIIGTSLLILNRILFADILRKEVLKIPIRQLFQYALPFFVTFLLFFYLFLDSDYKHLVFVYGLFSVVLGTLSFANFLNTKKNEDLLFFFGIALLIIADCLMAIRTFLYYDINYVIVYNTMYVIARFLICLAMIRKGAGKWL